MNYNSLDKKVVISWRIARAIRLVFAILFLGIITLILSYQPFFKEIQLIVIAIDTVVILYSLITLILYPIIEYRQWKYIVSDDRVEIKFGLFFIRTSIIPVIRIQHITVFQGPLYRLLGLSKVMIHTASGVFEIIGLKNEDAIQISDNLKQKLQTRLEEKEMV